MSPATTVSGLVSGFDTNQIVQDLLAVERVSIDRLRLEQDAITEKLSAFQSLSLQLLDMKINALSVNQKLATGSRTASSSNSSILTASVSGVPDPASHSLKVMALARGEESLSQGFASKTSPLIGTGTLTIRTGNATDDQDVNGFTKLSFLNNGSGVSANSIQITDRSGAMATIDLSGAVTVQDVLDSISGNTSVSVTAGLNADGTGLLITDNSGSTNGTLKILESGGTTAADLGIKTASGGVAANSLTGTDLDPTYKVDIDATNNTLEGIRDALNDLNGPFSTSIINDGSATVPFRLAVNSQKTGVIGAMTLGSTSTLITNEAVGTGDGTLGSTLGDYSLGVAPIDAIGDITSVTVAAGAYTVRVIGGNTGTGNEVEIDINTGKMQFFVNGVASNVTGAIEATYTPDTFTFTEVQSAQDSQVEFGSSSPLTINKHTNVLSDVITGLTINLVKADTTETVQVNVDVDLEDTKAGIQTFLDTYNTVLSTIQGHNKFDAATGTKGGALFGDTSVQLIETDLVASMTDPVAGLPSTFNSLFQIGVTPGANGQLTIDTGILDDKLRNNLKEVQDIFSFKSSVIKDAVLSASSTFTGFSVADLGNGVTSSANFGAGLEGWQDNTASTSPDYVTAALDKARYVSKVVINTVNSASLPAKDYGVSDYELQYLKIGGDPSKDGDYVTSHIISGNTDGQLTHFLSAYTDRLRLKITGTNAADGYARLVEFDVFEAAGVGSRSSSILDQITDATNGQIAFSQKSLQDEIGIIEDRITVLEDRMDVKELQLLDEFSQLESILGNLQTTSNFLTQQLNAFNANNNR